MDESNCKIINSIYATRKLRRKEESKESIKSVKAQRSEFGDLLTAPITIISSNRKVKQGLYLCEWPK